MGSEGPSRILAKAIENKVGGPKAPLLPCPSSSGKHRTKRTSIGDSVDFGASATS